jgi:hypothetical protein
MLVADRSHLLQVKVWTHTIGITSAHLACIYLLVSSNIHSIVRMRQRRILAILLDFRGH